MSTECKVVTVAGVTWLVLVGLAGFATGGCKRCEPGGLSPSPVSSGSPGSSATFERSSSAMSRVESAKVHGTMSDNDENLRDNPPIPSRPQVVDAQGVERDFQEDDSQMRARNSLVDSLVRSERLSESVQKAMREVPRHAFVPSYQLGRAYHDTALGIGYEQTISQPTVVAMMTEALALRGNERVLEIGTGSGYQAAVLSRLCAHVETMEIVLPLAIRARAALTRIGYDNVRVWFGDGYGGLPELGPFDRIIITAAPPEVPVELIKQLKTGGKMVLPVGPRAGIQQLVVLEKAPDGRMKQTDLGAVRFVPMVPRTEKEEGKQVN